MAFDRMKTEYFIILYLFHECYLFIVQSVNSISTRTFTTLLTISEYLFMCCVNKKNMKIIRRQFFFSDRDIALQTRIVDPAAVEEPGAGVLLRLLGVSLANDTESLRPPRDARRSRTPVQFTKQENELIN